MSANFLHVSTDETPELQRQIGCMTGIFQMFDRQHILAGKRISSAHNHMRHPSGHALSTSASLGAEHGAGSPQIVLEKNQSLNENRRISMESSRTSFSSSSCSSFSSLEYNKSTQQEPLSFDRTIVAEKSSKGSPKLRNPIADGRPPRHEPHGDALNASVLTVRRSLDFRDVVKDSINKDSRGLSVKTSPKHDVKNYVLKHRDSPRPMRLPKAGDGDGSYVIEANGKSVEAIDLGESLRVLVKLKEAPWNFSEYGESPRTSFEANACSVYPEPREAHRHSYDGREILHQFLDSQDGVKSHCKLREPPRLSLDSREGSMRNSNVEPKPYSMLKDIDGSNSTQSISMSSTPEPESVNHKRSTSVVAKLMGLEALPSLSMAARHPVYSSKDRDPTNEQIPKPLQIFQDNKEGGLSSPTRPIKGPVKPRRNDHDSRMKPSSKIQIETAPWKQQENHHRRSKFTRRDAQLQQQPESVCSEIERRLKELEFRQSNKDLRALKQILDAMQEKGLLETKRGERETTRDNGSLRSAGGQKQKIESLISPPTNGIRSLRTFESHIVIMKPASSVKRLHLPPSSVVPLETVPGIRKLQACATMDKRKVSTSHQGAKEQTFNASLKELSDKRTSTRIEGDVSLKVRPKTVQVSSRPQPSTRENSGSSLKTSGSLSPRLLQKKLEAGRSNPPLPSPESSKPQRSSADRMPLESVSPRGKLRQKQAQARDRDEQMSGSSEKRTFSYQGDEISQRPDVSISLSSLMDVKATSADRSSDDHVSQQGSKSPSGRAARKAASVKKQKNLSVSLSGEVSASGLTIAVPEQPSPISVLDGTFGHDDLASSPSTKDTPKDEKNRTSDGHRTPSRSSDASTSDSGSEISQKKLRSIESLVQKLNELCSEDDGTSTKDYIALLCDTQSPDHRYVSEILLASGLLLKDLSAGPNGPTPVQLHHSGHPINPDLFLVLEQTKSNPAPATETNTLQPKTDHEKLHRKLLFDVVNEVLIRKLELTGSIRTRPPAIRYPSGQQLLKELCMEIERYRALTAPDGESSDVEVRISDEEVIRQSEGWVDFDREVPGVVLEIERSIFKELIGEVVNVEALPRSQSKPSSRRRQLFAK